MSITGLVQQMLILLIFLFVGLICRKTGIIDIDFNKKFTTFLLYITQPAMIVSSALSSNLDFSPADVCRMLLYACVMYAVLILLAVITSPLYRVPLTTKKIFRFMTIFGNVAFMGYPVINAIYGSDAVLIASILCIPFNVLCYSVGVLMVSGRKDTKIDLKMMINPAMISTLAALVIIFAGIKLPYVINEACSTLGSVTTSGAMIVIGANLGSSTLKEIFTDAYTYLLCFMKLVAAPAAVWFVCRLFVYDPLILGIIVVLSSMPVASMASMLSLAYDGDCRTASRGVLLSTVFAVATSPVMIYLLIGVN